MPNPTRLIAFLRGINVAGRTIKMDQLRACFESLGFKNVKTLLASGNVLFDSPEADPATIKTKIESGIQSSFGHKVGIILRPLSAIQAIINSEPFKNVPVTPDTRLYVTFLSESTIVKPPPVPTGQTFEIISTSPLEVFTVVTLTPSKGTLDAMNFLDKTYGKLVTTRNWNTICKLVK